MSEVVAMKDHQSQAPAVQQVPMVGFSITANLYGERNIVFQSAYPSDFSDKDADAVVNAVMRQADRMKARYKIEEIEADIRKHREMRRHQENLLDGLDAQERDKLDGLSKRIAAQTERKSKAFELGEAKHNEAGRPGPYRPGGSAQSEISACDSDIARAKNEMTEVRAETQKGKVNIAGTLAEWDKIIATSEAELERLKALV
jgi:chromosome segregation ATPase